MNQVLRLQYPLFEGYRNLIFDYRIRIDLSIYLRKYSVFKLNKIK